MSEIDQLGVLVGLMVVVYAMLLLAVLANGRRYRRRR